MRRRAQDRLAVAGLAAVLLAGAPAAGEGHMAVQAGGFVPWQGDAGPSMALQLLGSGASSKARFGGEFEYRSFDSKIMGVSDVDVDSYIFRAIWQQHFTPDRPITPYIGLGLGVAINDVDDHKVDRVKGRNVRSSTGAGPDGLFMLGIAANVPGADYLSVYVEGRVGFTVDIVSRNDGSDLESENVGGASGNAGLRFRF
jgi:hypothetical protein